VPPSAGLTVNSSAQLHVCLWKHDQYLAAEEEGPESLIDLENIVSHVVRYTASVGSERV
jgi:hypothetical protein